MEPEVTWRLIRDEKWTWSPLNCQTDRIQPRTHDLWNEVFGKHPMFDYFSKFSISNPRFQNAYTLFSCHVEVRKIFVFLLKIINVALEVHFLETAVKLQQLKIHADSTEDGINPFHINFFFWNQNLQFCFFFKLQFCIKGFPYKLKANFWQHETVQISVQSPIGDHTRQWVNVKVVHTFSPFLQKISLRRIEKLIPNTFKLLDLFFLMQLSYDFLTFCIVFMISNSSYCVLPNVYNSSYGNCMHEIQNIIVSLT